MIQVKNLRKSYQTVNTSLEVLKGVDVQIDQGSEPKIYWKNSPLPDQFECPSD